VISRADIARRRLANQDLIRPASTRPADVVRRLGAVQAQDFAGAKWAIGLRTRGVDEQDVDRAFDDGDIIRTHVLRPTWHFVAPADLRWMLSLSAARIRAACGSWYRQHALDAATFRRSRRVLEKALGGGRHLTRAELASAYERAGIVTGPPPRLSPLLIDAELDGLVCSGPRRGKHFTYALVDERVPPAAPVARDEALLDLTMRYFAARGPATPMDFAWWSGLTAADARRGIAIAGGALTRETGDGVDYWMAKGGPRPRKPSGQAHLLPNYDEYYIGFKDRSAIVQSLEERGLSLPREAFVAHLLTMDGQVVGAWTRTIENDAVRVELTPLIARNHTHRRAMIAAAQRLGRFLGRPVELSIQAR
jgi:hypothetical protein